MTQTTIPFRTPAGHYRIWHICGHTALLDFSIRPAGAPRDRAAFAACQRVCHECQSAAHWARIDATAARYDGMMANSQGSLGQPYFTEVG